MKNWIWVALLGAALSACAAIPSVIVAPTSQTTPDHKFQYDLKGDINGYHFDGVGTVPLNDQNAYTLNVTSDVDVDLMTITTCHRDWSDQDQPITSGGWFTPHRGFTFTFSLAHGIEDYGTCLLRIGAYNKGGNPQQWAIVDFLTPDSELPAVNKCNGDQGTTHGVSICQSKAGLDEEIDFASPVEIADATNVNCKPRVPKDGMHWIYTLPNQECVVYFMEVAAPHRFHRHSFFGYTQIQLRSN
jgi:hypothetical protein